MAGYFKSVENYKDPYTIVDFAVDYNTPPKYKGMSSIKGRATRDSKDNPKNWDLNNLDGEQVERLTAMMYTISKILIGHIVTKFIDIELSRIATAMIVRKPSNEKMYQFISKSIDDIYKKDPKLHAIPLEKFKKTGLINYNMSNFRERSLDDVLMQVEIEIKYEGYIKRQISQVEAFKKMEGKKLPDDIDYDDVGSLRLEARAKLKALRPSSVGQASRISGVSPAAISVLLVYLEHIKNGNK